MNDIDRSEDEDMTTSKKWLNQVFQQNIHIKLSR